MAGIPSTARVVIIGGGAVGVSSLYHLAKAGWTDCVLLEKNELTSGSTWHAAGNVPTFSSSWSLMNMQRYSAELYRGLAEAVDYPMNYHVTGSLRLAHTKERLQRIPARQGHGPLPGHGDRRDRRWTRSSAAIPSSRRTTSKGALYDPNDGDIDPAQLTQALAKGARDMGAKIVRFCPVTGVAPRERRVGGRDAAGRDPLRICRQRRRLPRQRGRKDVRPRRADDGDEPSVHPVRGDPRTGGLVEGSRPQAAAAARRRHLLLSAPGKERHESRPLRAQLPRALGRPQRSDAGRFLLPALPRRSGAAGMVSERRDRARADPRHGRACPR